MKQIVKYSIFQNPGFYLDTLYDPFEYILIYVFIQLNENSSIDYGKYS